MTQYNHIYGLLVNGTDDLQGQVAYALYKGMKMEFIRSIKEREHREPTDEEFNTFHSLMSTPEQIQMLQDRAILNIQNLLLNTMQDEISSIQGDLKKEQITMLKSIVADLTPSWMTTIVQNIVGSIAFMSLLTLLALGVKFFGGDLLSTLRVVFSN